METIQAPCLKDPFERYCHPQSTSAEENKTTEFVRLDLRIGNKAAVQACVIEKMMMVFTSVTK